MSKIVPLVVVAATIGMVSCAESSATLSPAAPPEVVESAPPASPVPAEFETPIIFIHGYLGSGVQYRSEALRFTSNGYPATRIRAFDYGTMTVDPAALGAFIDGVRREFGVSKVHLVAHSLGTGSVATFLGDRDNAARVDKVVLVDGVACPDGFAECRVVKATDGQKHYEDPRRAARPGRDRRQGARPHGERRARGRARPGVGDLGGDGGAGRHRPARHVHRRA